MIINPQMTKKDLDKLRWESSVVNGLLMENPTTLTPKEIQNLKDHYTNDVLPRRVNTTSDKSYHKRLDYWNPINYIGMIVDKLASMLYSREVTRTVENEQLQEYINNTFRNKESVMLLMAKLASLGGYAAIRLRRKWTGERTFSVYGLDDVTPLLDPHNPFGPIEGIIFHYNTDGYSLGFNKKEVEVTELITKNHRDAEGNIVAPGVHKLFYDNAEQDLGFNGINPLGDFLGVVWCRNIVHPMYASGKSDVLQLLSLVENINELICDGMECAAFGVHSPVVATGVKGKIEWEYEPRAVWTASDGAEVKRLESSISNLEDLEKFLQFLVNEFHMSSRVPSVAVGDLKNIGNLSSGRAYQIAMTPTTELIKEKEYCAKEYELELVRELAASLLYYEEIDGSFTAENVYEITKSFEIQFEPMNMFEDPTKNFVDEPLTSRVAGGITSVEVAIRELHPDWNAEQIKLELQTIEATKVNDTAMLEEQKLQQMRDRINE